MDEFTIPEYMEICDVCKRIPQNDKRVRAISRIKISYFCNIGINDCPMPLTYQIKNLEKRTHQP